MWVGGTNAHLDAVGLPLDDLSLVNPSISPPWDKDASMGVVPGTTALQPTRVPEPSTWLLAATMLAFIVPVR